MEEELDVNKIAAEIVSQQLKEFLNFGKGIFKTTKDKVFLSLKSTYEKYLDNAVERHSKSRSFFFRTDSSYLYDYYVPQAIKSKNIKIDTPTIKGIIGVNKNSIITGTGGCGKSTLMKHLFLSYLLEKEKIPVFVELRELNDKQCTLIELLCENISCNDGSLDNTYITKALELGHFCILLDGYDEIENEKKKSLRLEIIAISKLYPKNVLVLSSRPDNEFYGWANFSIFSVCELNIHKACQLIEKLPYDDEIKAKFVKELVNGVFEKHKSFLSNPLLLTIMLLTYGKSADIPNKINVFYNQSYEALYQSHDALKGGYQRQKTSGLDIQDFAKVFACFCIQSYDKRDFTFSKSQALTYLDNAKKICNISFNAELYLDDALKAVCLLVEDGLFITYTHRSFQEYFVAKFILESRHETQVKLLDKYINNLGSDSVIPLLWEMNPILVEKAVILPQFDKVINTLNIKGKIGIRAYVKWLKLSWDSFEITSDGELTGLHTDNTKTLNALIDFALKNYANKIGFVGFKNIKSHNFESNYKIKNDTFIYDASKANINDEFIKDLFEHGRYFSVLTLQLILSIRNYLVQSHNDHQTSVEELLFN